MYYYVLGSPLLGGDLGVGCQDFQARDVSVLKASKCIVLFLGSPLPGGDLGVGMYSQHHRCDSLETKLMGCFNKSPIGLYSGSKRSPSVTITTKL